MTEIACGADGSCPYMYSCQADLCVHDPIFPLSGYAIFIYCLYPIASAICNTSGNSFGEFKVLLLMDSLDYSQSHATTLSYPLILGTALFNIVRLILKRHPYKETSLVDYNLVLIIIPCVLYGSTIGSLVNNFIPPIVADCLIVALLTAFSTKFFLKLKALRKKSKEGNQRQNKIEESVSKKIQQEKRNTKPEVLQTIQMAEASEHIGNRQKTGQLPEVELQHQNEAKQRARLESQDYSQGQPVQEDLPNDPIDVILEEAIEMGVVPETVEISALAKDMQLQRAETYKHKHIMEIVENSLEGDSSGSNNSNKQCLLADETLENPIKMSRQASKSSKRQSHQSCLSKQHNPFSAQLQAQFNYQKTYHWKHIIAIMVLFAVFEAAAFLAQGKIIHFGFCSFYYGLGLGLLSLFFIIVLGLVYTYTRRQLKYYHKIGYQYEYPLHKLKYFGLICIGSFLGGFNGGVFAIGNSTTIIFTLLYLQVEPIVTSATVGFQVVFAAAASLCEAMARGTIGFEEVLFFFLLTLIGGGILSFIANYLVGKLDREKVNMILVGIVACLTGASALSMVVNIALGYSNFGAHYMIATDIPC